MMPRLYALLSLIAVPLSLGAPAYAGFSYGDNTGLPIIPGDPLHAMLSKAAQDLKAVNIAVGDQACGNPSTTRHEYLKQKLEEMRRKANQLLGLVSGALPDVGGTGRAVAASSRACRARRVSRI